MEDYDELLDDFVPRYEYERLENEHRRLKRAYEELKEYKEDLEAILNKVKSHPLDYGFIVEKLEDGAIVNINGSLKSFPYGILEEEEIKSLERGQYVFIGSIPDPKNPMAFTTAITKLHNKKVDLIVGEIESILKDDKGWAAEISTGRSSRKIYKRFDPDNYHLKEGMKLGLIPGTLDIIESHKTPETSRFEVIKKPEVSFNDIGGLEEVKKELVRSLILPMINQEDYEQYGESSRRILMYGPPGCGKTMCAKALASILPNCEFVKVGAGELYTMWLGESERNVRLIFQTANQKLEEGENDYGIIFFDEIDALAQQRGVHIGSSGAPERVVGQLLDTLDGFYELHPHLAVIGATNRLHLIDSAFRTRFDKIIEVPKPDKDAGKSIALKYAKKVPIDQYLIEKKGNINKAREYLVEELIDIMYSDKSVETEIGTIERKEVVTGRLIAQIFRYAKDRALEERTIYKLKQGAPEWEKVCRDILDAKERAVQLGKKYKNPKQIGIDLELLKESYYKFINRRAEEMITSGYQKGYAVEETGMHY
ncbi:MAG TPA: 26S protease regulatory subunit [Methanosarcinales archaeon]|nr:26S protease regulatory subunit [Methanosarcinales archaeon]